MEPTKRLPRPRTKVTSDEHNERLWEPPYDFSWDMTVIAAAFILICAAVAFSVIVVLPV